jgi:hypothetical protein
MPLIAAPRRKKMAFSKEGGGMAIKTFEVYYDRLKKMRSNVYLDGEKISRTDERLRAGINVIKETYDRTNDPTYEDIWLPCLISPERK